MSETRLRLMAFVLCLSSIHVLAEVYKSESFTPELLKKAEAGDLNAQLHIAECYDKGLGVQKNAEKADFWFKKIQEQANKKAASINKTLDEVVKVADKTAESMKQLVEDMKKQYANSRAKAEQGDPPSQLIIGLAHLETNSFVPFDKNEAYKWIKKASDNGDICGKYFLAKCMREGIGTPINTEQSGLIIAEIEKSASPSMLKDLGGFLIKRCRYANDEEEGIIYLSKAAERGDVNAQLFLSDYFYNTDPKQSAKWTKKASDQGNADGQASLGMALIMGRGVPEDKTLGVQLLKKSADRSNPAGMYGLGICCINGNGIEKDMKHGGKLIKSAANSGFQPAVDWIQKNPDKISKTQIRYDEVKEQLQFYKDLNPEDKKAKENRQQMINALITEQNSLLDQLFRENQAH
jgi:TPR repeat protein